MNSTESTETKPSCVREVEVEVPADVLTREVESLVKRYSKVAKVPGFRPGKVPPTVVKRQYGEGLMQEAIENVVNRVTPEEIKKRNLAPISQPRIVDMHAHEGEPMRFKAVFEILPEVEISDYKNLAPEQPEITVTDQDVEETLQRVREQHATYNAVEEDRELRDGDFAQVSIEGIPHPLPTDAPAAESAEAAEGASESAEAAPSEGTEKPKAATEKAAEQPVKIDEVMIEIGNPNTVKEFTENLRGVKPGESKSFDVRYPDDYADQRLAGRTFSYTMQVKGIKTKLVPELNDDFAKELGEFASMDDVRARIREGIEHEKRHQAEHAAKDHIINELLKKADFPLPQVLVEQAINSRLDRGLRALAAQGMKPEDMRRMDFQRLRAGQREAAERDVKASMVLDKIAELENIDVTEEELNAQIEGLAYQHRQPVEQVREGLIREGGLGRMRDTLREQKTIEFLYRGTVPGSVAPEAAASQPTDTATETEKQ